MDRARGNVEFYAEFFIVCFVAFYAFLVHLKSCSNALYDALEMRLLHELQSEKILDAGECKWRNIITSTLTQMPLSAFILNLLLNVCAFGSPGSLSC